MHQCVQLAKNKIDKLVHFYFKAVLKAGIGDFKVAGWSIKSYDPMAEPVFFGAKEARENETQYIDSMSLFIACKLLLV